MEQVRDLALFEGIGKRTWRQVRELGTPVLLREGRVLCRQGVWNEQFFVVVSGAAIVSNDGGEVTRLGAGDWFGETTASRPGGGPATATVVADGPLEVVVYDRREYAALRAFAPAVAERIDGTVAERRPAPSPARVPVPAFA